MKVIQVYGGPVHGTLGGHEYVVRKLSEELSKHGLKVKVLCPSLSKNPLCHKVGQIEYVEIRSHRVSIRTHFNMSFMCARAPTRLDKFVRSFNRTIPSCA